MTSGPRVSPRGFTGLSPDPLSSAGTTPAHLIRGNEAIFVRLRPSAGLCRGGRTRRSPRGPLWRAQERASRCRAGLSQSSVQAEAAYGAIFLSRQPGALRP